MRVDRIGYCQELVKLFADPLKAAVKAKMLDGDVGIVEGDRYEVRQTDTGKELFHWHRAYDGSTQAVSPDGRFLTIRHRTDLELLDVESGKIRRRMALLLRQLVRAGDLATCAGRGHIIEVGDGSCRGRL